MKKRIVICSDGTWNRPEKNPKEDFPTNVLRLARAIQPVGKDGTPQQVFYDWGVGSYYQALLGGATGMGLEKNILDAYRYIVQNYSAGDEIFLFGFSRGAYTVRCLSGLIYNCGIVKRPEAKLVEDAFRIYKTPSKSCKPDGETAIEFRNTNSHKDRKVTFIGVWDTVGALGIPFSFLGLFDKREEFYDTKIGPNVAIARHALAIDELREDFAPTIWNPREGLDLKQVWFAGVHCDVGGSYPPDKGTEALLCDIPLAWMTQEAKSARLTIEPHLSSSLKGSHTATLHDSRKHIYRSKSPVPRTIDHGHGKVLIHSSVKQRWDEIETYRPQNLQAFLADNGNQWPLEN